MSPEAERLRAMLEQYRGQWVAVDHQWSRVLAANQDRRVCVWVAMNRYGLSDEPTIYRVPTVEESAAFACLLP